MEIVPQVLFILFLITKTFAQETATLEHKDVTADITTPSTIQTGEEEKQQSLQTLPVRNATKTEELDIIVLTETTKTTEDLIETTTMSSILNIPENQLHSPEDINSNSPLIGIVTSTTFKTLEPVAIELQDVIKDISENTTTEEEKEDEEITTTIIVTIISEDQIHNSTTTGEEPNAKPHLSLEDYAITQMNYVLDHLLMENQEFAAKVLQASVNTVFARTSLKCYAERINRLLNPNDSNEYTDELIEQPKILTSDATYEQILLKLQFFKGRFSRLVQDYLPRNWLSEHQQHKADLAIWLDKAAEQMRQQFNRYVSEEEDRIKYQYFNEAFDDISRATEIHHKLILLEDLVKIVKNKKQISFMDLYMQN